MTTLLKSIAVALTLSTVAATTSANEYRAVQDSTHRAHHVSVGVAMTEFDTKYDDNFDALGLGASYIYLGENSEWGGYVGLEHTKDSTDAGEYYSDDELLSISVGPVYQPSNAKWFRFYPSLGYTHYKVDMKTAEVEINDSFHGINVGAGAQIAIPRTYMHFDINAKYHALLNDSMKDANIYSYYVGVGYRF